MREARRPLIVAGGGVIYAEATDALAALAEATGIPVGETQAGRGALPSDHPAALGAIGATGTPAANRLAREADLVIGVGTRWSDFTTASKSAFQDPGVRFVNINVASLDAAKHSGLALLADARLALEALQDALAGHRVDEAWSRRAAEESAAWGREVERLVHAGHTPLPSQAEVIGAVNAAAGPADVVVCAAGSMPGDLHKLWRARDPKGYHVEYGYSCMGYEIPGGIGVKLAAPEREVFVMIGDGSYLMLPGELVTAVAEGVKLVVVLVQNHGYASIGALSRSVGSAGFGTRYVARRERGAAARRRPARRAAAGRPRRQRREPRRAGAASAHDRRAARRARAGEGGRRAGRGARRGRPLRGRAELRELVGRAGGGDRGRRVGARGARGVRARAAVAAAVPGDAVSLVVRGPVTPASAGWSYVGFEALALRRRRAGRARHRRSDELCIVVDLRAPARCGRRTASGAISAGGPIRSRACRTPPTCRRGTRYVLEGDGEVGLCSAPAGDGAAARVLPAPRSRPRRAATARTSARSTRS